MIMLGTLINTGAIIAGGVVGSFFQRGLKERFQETLMSAMGLSVILLSIGGVCSEMLTLQNGQLETQGVLMMIVSLALGALVGEAINLEHHTQTFGAFLREKSGNCGDNKFVDAFVTRLPHRLHQGHGHCRLYPGRSHRDISVGHQSHPGLHHHLRHDRFHGQGVSSPPSRSFCSKAS